MAPRSNKNKICFVSYGPISYDVRLQKASKILVEAGHEVVILAKKSNNPEVRGFVAGVEVQLLEARVHSVIKPSKARNRILRVAWNLLLLHPATYLFGREKNIEIIFLQALKKTHAHIVTFINYYTNELQTKYKKPKHQKVIYETYEYYPTYFRNKFHNLANLSDDRVSQLAQYEVQAVRSADVTICVSEEIADRYSKEYQSKKPEVLYNCPITNALEPSAVGDTVKFYLQTGLRMNYGIEEAIAAFSQVKGNFSFTIQGRELFNGYADELRQLISELNLDEKVVILDPCGYDDVVTEANTYDIGISALPLWVDGVFEENHYLSLPNKYFVYANAGLGQLIGDHPSMVRAAHGVDMFETFSPSTPDDLARKIQALIDDPQRIMLMKKNAHLWAKRYGSGDLIRKIIDIYSKVN